MKLELYNGGMPIGFGEQAMLLNHSAIGTIELIQVDPGGGEVDGTRHVVLFIVSTRLFHVGLESFVDLKTDSHDIGS